MDTFACFEQKGAATIYGCPRAAATITTKLRLPKRSRKDDCQNCGRLSRASTNFTNEVAYVVSPAGGCRAPKQQDLVQIQRRAKISERRTGNRQNWVSRRRSPRHPAEGSSLPANHKLYKVGNAATTGTERDTGLDNAERVVHFSTSTVEKHQ